MPSVDVCNSCKCGLTVDPETGLLAQECEPISCSTTCEEVSPRKSHRALRNYAEVLLSDTSLSFSLTLQGYEYQPVAGKCCGQCVRTSCVIVINNVTYTIPVRHYAN